MKKAIFLDRDGTINEDPGYMNHPDQLRIFEGAGPALKKFQDAGFELIVVTNQSGIGRGFLREQDLKAIHEKMDTILVHDFGVKIKEFLHCSHHPEDECECRKPKPKLFLEAAKKFGVSLKDSWMIGDRISDMRAGLNAGLKGAILVRTGLGEENVELFNELKASSFVKHISKDISDAAQWVTGRD